MAIPIFIDATTGEARDSLNGPVRPRFKFFLNDLTPLSVAFVQNGQNITNAVLENGDATMKVGIRARPGQGGILCQATSYVLSGGEAAVILPMNAGAMVAYFADTAVIPATKAEAILVLEVEVQNQAGTSRLTYYQAPCVVGREVNSV